MKIKLSYILVMLGALCASCSDFLDVQPSDRISEGQNFSTVAGFKQALNGIYIDLNASELYGRTLSVVLPLCQDWKACGERLTIL